MPVIMFYFLALVICFCKQDHIKVSTKESVFLNYMILLLSSEAEVANVNFWLNSNFSGSSYLFQSNQISN